MCDDTILCHWTPDLLELTLKSLSQMVHVSRWQFSSSFPPDLSSTTYHEPSCTWSKGKNYHQLSWRFWTCSKWMMVDDIRQCTIAGGQWGECITNLCDFLGCISFSHLNELNFAIGLQLHRKTLRPIFVRMFLKISSSRNIVICKNAFYS